MLQNFDTDTSEEIDIELRIEILDLFLTMFLKFIFYKVCKIKWYEAWLIMSNVHLLSPVSICTSPVSRFLASIFPSFMALLLKECLHVTVFRQL